MRLLHMIVRGRALCGVLITPLLPWTQVPTQVGCPDCLAILYPKGDTT